MDKSKQLTKEARKFSLLKQIFESVINDPSIAEGYERRDPMITVDRPTIQSIQNPEDAKRVIEQFIKDAKGDYETVTIGIDQHEVSVPEGLATIEKRWNDPLQYRVVTIATNTEFNKWKNRFSVQLQLEPTSQEYHQAVKSVMSNK